MSNNKGFLAGVVIGSLVGAATALFLAPRSGRELRQSVSDLTAKTSELTETARTKGIELVQSAKEKTLALTKKEEETVDVQVKLQEAQAAFEQVEEQLKH